MRKKYREEDCVPAQEIFTGHPNGGYFCTTREYLMKDFYDGYEAKVFVYKFSHIEVITKKTEVTVKKWPKEKYDAKV